MSATPTRWVINVEYDFETEREIVEYEHVDACKDRHCIGECNEAASSIEESEVEGELFSYSSESAPAHIGGAFAALAALGVK